MKLAYADPVYLGMARRYPEHPGDGMKCIALLLLLTSCASTGGVKAADMSAKDSPRVATPSAAAVPAPPVARAARTRPTITSHPRHSPTAARVAGHTHHRATTVSGGQRLSVTAYTWTGNRTASGVYPRPGMAAGNRWPFGTRLRVEGVGIVTITDRIGHSSDLDLYLSSRSACLQFGRRSLRVEVVR